MASKEKTVSVTEFKAKCLRLIDELDTNKLSRVTIVKRGREVASMTAPSKKSAQRKPFGHGFLKGSVVIPKGLDLAKPVFEDEIDAEKGILHR
jgi:antitoxin (DNA-binding transcriptional repressor) of toxin-antitoxin stability system